MTSAMTESAEVSSATMAAPAHVALSYQAEVDGLRAVAVVPVVLFHAGFVGFSAGYLGVDVFFVISGYLITSLVLRDIAAGRFSVLAFYERRARRILPALFFVALCSIPLALLLMFPWQVADFGESLTATMGFYANQYFLSTLDYFREGSDHAPFLHMWSLAVEEQYYLLVPPVLWLAWMAGARRAMLLGLALAASLLSLVGAALIVTRWQQTAFYIFPTRAFELGVGSLLALALLDRPRPEGPMNGPLALLGLGMVVAPMLFLPSWAVLPSWPTLVPCVGAALVIAFASPGTAAHRLLASPVLVAVGLVSFSLYLWHQPLFAFARITEFRQPGDGLMLGLSLLALLLAALTWRYVERPFRDRTAISARGILGYGLASSAGLLLLAGVAPWLAASPTRYPPEQRQFTIPLADHADYVERGYNRLTQADFVDDGRRRLLIIGDSFSQDFYNMIAETGGFPGYQIVTRRFLSTCQIYLGPEDVTPLLGAEAANCARQVQAADLVPLAREADVVVFAFSWRPWSGARVAETIANFGFRDDQTVLVIGRKSFGYFNARSFLGMDPAARLALRNGPRPEHAATNEIMRRLVAPEMFVDTQALVCGAAPDCPLFAPDGGMISFDGNHLTRAGARYLGTLLFRDPRLAPFAPRTGAAL